MTRAELIQRILAIRYSSRTERNAGRAPSMNALANEVGLSRMQLYRIASQACNDQGRVRTGG